MAKENDPKPKIGAGHAEAMFRQGLREARNIFYPESNVAVPHAEYGVYGTRTPGEIAAERRADAIDRDEEPKSALERADEELGSRRDDPGKDKDRGKDRD